MKKHLGLIAATVGILLAAAVVVFVTKSLLHDTRPPSIPDNAGSPIYEEVENEHLKNSSIDAKNGPSIKEKEGPVSSEEEREISEEPLVPAAENGWRVVTLYGWPCSGAVVYAVPISRESVEKWVAMIDEGEAPEPETAQTICGPDGSFDFPDLKPGTYLIHAKKEGFGPGSALLDLTGSWPADFELRVDSSKTIWGDVVDSKGKPLKKAEIVCLKAIQGDFSQAPIEEKAETFLFSRNLETDSRGEFSIEGLAYSSDYVLNIDCEGYMSAAVSIPSYNNSRQHVVLKKRCVLEGRVLSSDNGKPIKKARVFYRGAGNSPYYDETFTDEKGHYRFDAAPEGESIFQATHDEWGNAGCRIMLVSGKENKKDFLLPKGIALCVKTLDLRGAPIKGVRITVKDAGNGALLGGRLTDEKGIARFTSLNGGEENLVVARDLSGKYKIKRGFYKFENDSDLVFRLGDRFSAKIKVLDCETRKPIDHVIIYGCAHHFNSSLQESMSLEKWVTRDDYRAGAGYLGLLIGPGEVEDLTFFAEGYQPATAVLMVRDPDAENYPVTEVLMRKAGSLSGTVVDGGTGEPIPCARVSCYMKGRLIKKPSYAKVDVCSCMTGKDGIFTLSGLADGSFFLEVRAKGYAPAVVDTCSLDHYGDVGSNVVRLYPGGTLFGNVTFGSGKPLENARVTVTLPDTDEKVSTTTSMDGKYAISGLPAGELHVSVQDMIDDRMTASRTFIAKAVKMPIGGSARADFAFDGDCSIGGTFRIEGDLCDWGARLSVVDDEGTVVRSAPVNDGSRYLIRRIPPGSYILKAVSTIAGKGALYEKKIRLDPGRELKIDIDIKGKAAFGVVRDSRRKPIDAAEVWILDERDARSHRALTNWDGSYAIFGVDKGEYRIVARAEGCAESIQGPFEIGGGRPPVEADFDLASGGIARVIVKSKEGEPVAGGLVLASEDFAKAPVRREAANYSGICVFDCLGPEKMIVLAGSCASGLAPGGAQFNAVSGDETDCEVVLVKGGNLRVLVKAKDGAPLPGASVSLPGFSLFGLDAFSLASLGLIETSDEGFRTNGTGEFLIGPLPPGPVRVRVQRGALSASGEAEVQSGKESRVTILLK